MEEAATSSKNVANTASKSQEAKKKGSNDPGSVEAEPAAAGANGSTAKEQPRDEHIAEEDGGLKAKKKS